MRVEEDATIPFIDSRAARKYLRMLLRKEECYVTKHPVHDSWGVVIRLDGGYRDRADAERMKDYLEDTLRKALEMKPTKRGI